MITREEIEEALFKKLPFWDFEYPLRDVIEAHPEDIETILDTLQKLLASDKNDSNSLRRAYDALTKIVKDNPQSADKVLEALIIRLASDRNDWASLMYAYDALAAVVEANPACIDKALEVLKQGLASNKNDHDSLGHAYTALAKIVAANPACIDKALELFKQGLASDKNNASSLADAYYALAKIIKANPACIDKALELFKQGLASDKNDSDSLRCAYDVLAKIIKDNPACIDKALEVLKQGLASDKNDSDSLRCAYDVLAKIVEANPACIDKALELFKQGLVSDKNNWESLEYAYKALEQIVAAKPEYADKVLELFKQVLASDTTDYVSLGYAYKTLAKILAANSQTADKVLEAVSIGLASDENNYYALQKAYGVLAKILAANPQSADKVLEAVNIGLASDQNDSDSLGEAYKTLAKVIEVKPELRSQVLSMLEAHYSSLPEQSQHGTFLDDSDIQRVRLLTDCLQGKKPQDWEAYSHIPDLDIAFKFRRSLPEEHEWMLTHIPVKQLQTMSLSAQQKALNIMVGLACKADGMAAPKAEDLRGLNTNEAVVQTFRDNTTFLVEASYKAGGVFGSFLPTYLKKMEPYFMGQNSKDTILGLDKVVGWFPDPMSPEKNKSFQDFCLNKIVHKTHQSIYDHQKKEVIYTPENAIDELRPVGELSVIAKNWAYLSPEEEKLPYNDILAICKSRKYTDQTYTEFAVEAASHGVAPDEYKKMESYYAAGLDTPLPFDTKARYEAVEKTKETYIDQKSGEEKTRTVEHKYTGRFLDRSDPRIGFFGKYTACCQHLMREAGTPCAVSSMKDPFSQLFVVENEKGEIIAGSWVWENTEGEYRKVCFDNIEALKAYSKKPFLNKIYEQAAKDLAQTKNVQQITIGRGYSEDFDLSKYDAAEEPISLPKAYGHQYSDSGEQVVLLENENAKPLDHSQDNDCFVRSVCAADLEQMKAISAECFEGEDKQLAISEDDTLPTGKVLVNRTGEVVGYLLYDEAEHRVDDLAVLDDARKVKLELRKAKLEGRKDESNVLKAKLNDSRKVKKASAFKLLASVMKDLKRIGGEWTAELRSDTSQPLLKALAAGGHITLSEGVFDRNMTNEKDEVVASFYRHKFKFVDKPAPQKANETESAQKVESEKTEAKATVLETKAVSTEAKTTSVESKEKALPPKAKDSKANQFMNMLTRLRGPRQAG